MSAQWLLGRRLKRSDLTSREILMLVDYWGVYAWERLVERFPPKLALAALEREHRTGRLESGVSPCRPWLTDAGRAFLADPEARRA